MELKQLIALTYAVSGASLAIGLTANYINSMKSELQEQHRTIVEKAKPKPAPITTVVIAAKPLTYGTKLRRSDLRQIRMPASSAPLNAYRTIDSLFQVDKETILQSALAEGEQLFPDKVVHTDEGTALALMLPPGLRAVTIKINEVRGVGGFVQPRDRVDVLLTDNAIEEGESERTTRVLLQNVLIMAIGQEISSKDREARIKKSITMAVNLRDAQKLALAVTAGQLSLALRNPKHPVKSGSFSVSLSDLHTDKPNSKSIASKIEVFRAAKATVYTISQSSGSRTK